MKAPQPTFANRTRQVAGAVSGSGLFLAALLLTACDTYQAPAHSTEVAIKGVQAASLSDDGAYALIGSRHHGGSLWRTADSERLFSWNHAPGQLTTILATSFSPGSTLADENAEQRRALTASGDNLVLWNLATGEAERFWKAPAQVLAASLDGSGEQALLGLAANYATLFNVARGGVVAELQHGDRVASVALSADGRLALTGSEDSTAKLWQVESGQMLHRIRHENEVQLVALSPDGSLALSASQYDKGLVWRTDTGEAIGEIPLNAERIKRGLRLTAAAFSRDNDQLLTGRQDGIVQLWRLPDLKLTWVWRLPKRDAWQPSAVSVMAVAFARRGEKTEEMAGKGDAGEGGESYYAVASNGFLHRLRRVEQPAD